MSSTLDPYQAWLSISTSQRPPDHYRLLGLDLYENDATAIRDAAARQTDVVRPHTQGSEQVAAQRLMGEIAGARVCLLSPPDKHQYDERLRRQPQVAAPVAAIPAMAAPQTNQPMAAVPVAEVATDETATAPVAEVALESAPEPAAVRIWRHRIKSRLSTPVVVGSVLAALAIVVFAVVYFSDDPPDQKHAANEDTSKTKENDSDKDHDDDQHSKPEDKKPASEKLALLPIDAQVTGPGEPVLVEPRVTDGEKFAEKITYKLAGKSPKGASIDSETGRLTWRPSSKHAGKTFQIKIVATAGDQSSRQSVSIRVEPVDPPPQLVTALPKPVDPKPPIDPPKPDPPPKDPEPTARQPVPQESELATARKLTDQVYREQLAAAVSNDERIDLAQKMMLTAKGSPSGSADRYILIQKATELIGSAGDAREAVAAVDQLAAQFDVDALKEKASVLDKVYVARGSKTAEASKQLALEAVRLANDAVDSDRFDDAISALRLANASARRAGNNELSRLALNRKRDIEKLQQQYAPIRQAKDVLAKTPDDAGANLYVGRWSAFVHADWKVGLPMLAKSSNDMLKKLADDELADPQAAGARVTLGDRWWDLAEKTEGIMRDQIQKHAIDWYKKALPDLSGLSAKAVQQRIDAFEQSNSSPMPDAASE